MKYELLYENFIEEVKKKIPHNSKLSAVLADILMIEKEAVYRRLRMDVPFTFAEIANVCRKLNISLDHIIESDPLRSRPLQLKLVNYKNLHEADFVMLEIIPELIFSVKNKEKDYIVHGCNSIPLAFYLEHEVIARFILFKWMYMSGNLGSDDRFADVIIPSRLRSVQLSTCEQLKNIGNTDFILDNSIFRYFVNNVKFFQSIHFLNEHDVEEIKVGLGKILDNIETLALRGRFPETGKRVRIYLSNMSFENSYMYFDSEEAKLSVFKIFTMNGIASSDEKTHENVKTWVQSLRRVSTLITESGEKERIHFLTTQRALLETL